MIPVIIVTIVTVATVIATFRYRSRANKYKHLYEEAIRPKPNKHTSPAALKAQSDRDKYLVIRSQILLRDGFRCQASKVSLPECNYYKHLEVHHIVPRSKGGTDDPANLITLCQRCHAKKHGFKRRENKRRIHTRRNHRKKFRRYLNKHKDSARVEIYPTKSLEDVHPHQEDHSPEAEDRRQKNYEKWEKNELNQT
jgi:5-methylcytosine-specific restriction endonuclease McrA